MMRRLSLETSRRDLFKNNLFIIKRWLQTIQISILQWTKIHYFSIVFSTFLKSTFLLIFQSFLQKNHQNNSFLIKFWCFHEAWHLKYWMHCIMSYVLYIKFYMKYYWQRQNPSVYLPCKQVIGTSILLSSFVWTMAVTVLTLLYSNALILVKSIILIH